MRVSYTFAIVLLLAFVAVAFEALGATHAREEALNGYQNLRDREFHKLRINGPAELKNIKMGLGNIFGDLDFYNLEASQKLSVRGNLYGDKGNIHKLHVIGSARLNNSNFRDVEVTGPLTLQNCSINGTTNVVGFLKATNSVLDFVDANVETIILEDSKVGTIRVVKHGRADEQRVVLNNSSAKNVVFESGNGKVAVIGSGEVTGKVKGGIIVQE